VAARTTYLSMEGGEMLALDTSAVINDTSPGKVISLNNDLITSPASRPIWGNLFPNCMKACPEGHSPDRTGLRPPASGSWRATPTSATPSGWPARAAKQARDLAFVRSPGRGGRTLPGRRWWRSRWRSG
jgi:hypothetical protein